MWPFDLLRGTPAVIFTLLACLSGLAASANGLKFDADGWYTWTVRSNAEAPDWCCFEWRSGKPRHAGCDLDGRDNGFTSSDDWTNGGDEMQIYVLQSGGTIDQIRAYSPQCPIRSESDITDLGSLETTESVSWLRQFVGTDSDVTHHALAAISVHEDAQSAAALIDAIENRDLSRDDRREAFFWLAHSGTDEAIAYFDEIFSGT